MVFAAWARSKAFSRSFARRIVSSRDMPRSMPAYTSSCRPVSRSKIWSGWGITPIMRLAVFTSLHTSRPRIIAVPASGTSRPVTMLSVVVLPAPFGPTRP